MAQHLPEFEPFDLNGEPTSLGIQWKRWSVRLENLFVALNIGNKVRQKALLLHYGGKDFMILCESILDEGDTYDVAKEKLDQYFEPKVNLTFETYCFRSMKQEEDETVAQYFARLKPAALRCEFADIDRELKDHIVMTCQSQNLRKKALRDDFDLEELLKCARSYENSDRQAALMDSSSDVQRINRRKSKRDSARYGKSAPKAGKEVASGSNTPNRKKTPDSKSKNNNKRCFNCGGVFPHPNGQKCPAQGTYCTRCTKPNHYASECRSEIPVNNILDEYSSDGDEDPEVHTITAGTVHQVENDQCINTTTTRPKSRKNLALQRIVLNGTKIDVQIDSGSEANIISEEDFGRLKNRPKLHRTSTKLYPFATPNPLKLLGKFTGVVETPDSYKTALF